MPSIRAFIAIETPESTRKDISVLQTELRKSKADVRWEPEEKFHATIKFLGDVDENQLATVISMIEAVAAQHEGCMVVFEKLGCFPNARNPRVVWVGCSNPDGKLEALKTILDKELHSFGFEIETRPFHPHITLGRVKSPQGNRNLISILENLTFEPHACAVKELVVMRSVLKPSGSEYSILKKVQLKP